MSIFNGLPYQGLLIKFSIEEMIDDLGLSYVFLLF